MDLEAYVPGIPLLWSDFGKHQQRPAEKHAQSSEHVMSPVLFCFYQVPGIFYVGYEVQPPSLLLVHLHT